MRQAFATLMERTVISITAFAQALSILDSPSVQLAHPLTQAAQVLLSHVFLSLLSPIMNRDLTVMS